MTDTHGSDIPTPPESGAKPDQHGDAPGAETPEKDPKTPDNKRKHWIKPAWLRIPLKVLMWIVIVVALLPVLLYIPFVQDFVVGIAKDVVRDKTGMEIGIGELRISFPVDVHLKDVYVVEATGDTMVRASEAVADVKLLPLLSLDVQVKRLQLQDGYYRMVAPDTSMIMKVNAGFLEVDDKSSVDIRTSLINLHKVKLRDGRLSLYMDVWKKQPVETDTAATSGSSAPFRILAEELDLENFGFGMSMLPTIDTLNVDVDNIKIRKAKVDLGENLVQWGLAAIDGGSFKYLTPTPEYIKTHPAPPSTPSTGPPMRIMGDSISLAGLDAVYGVKGATPQPGFDANMLMFSGVEIALRDFYNESSTVRLPISRMKVRERCGLQIVDGNGTVAIDSVGLRINGLNIKTLYSALHATADLPFAAMAMQPDVAMRAEAGGRIGLPDVEAFMPTLKPMLSNIPARKPVDFKLDAVGSINDMLIDRLDVDMPGVVALNAKGKARNALDYKKLEADLTFDGTLSDPTVADRLVQLQGMKIPAFTIEGTANARGLSYGADFSLRSDAGDLNALGHVALTPEDYSADIDAMGIDVARFMPDLGIGRVSAKVEARGHGFNPLSGSAVTDATVNVGSIEYKGRELRDIKLLANLSNAGDLTLHASSLNPGLDFDLNGSGTIHNDDYTFDIAANLRDINLQQIGISDSICYGSGILALKGNAQPGKWIYDVTLDASSLEWNLPGTYIHLPQGVTADVKTDFTGTNVDVNSLLTNLHFQSPTGMESIVDSFGKVGSMLVSQIERKSVAVDSISSALPTFTLDLNASGRGLLDQFLSSSGVSVDTVSARIVKDSLIAGDIYVANCATPSMSIDTITLKLQERGSLLDYKAHMGNRRGTLDEFAKVDLSGYVGENRVSAFLKQWNIKGEQGYRIGLTAAVADSVVTAHITPLKSTIAYMPWTFNGDNFIDFNLHNKHIAANMKAASAESSILAKTQTADDGNEELYLNIDNLHIQDFLRMWALAPQMKGDLDADMHVKYDNRRFSGSGSVSLTDFVYEKTNVGDFKLDLDAGYGLDGGTDVTAGLLVNGRRAISAYASLLPDANDGMKPDSIGVSLTRFPLSVANSFMGGSVTLEGFLNGDMSMEGSFAAPVLNGEIAFDSVTARIPNFGAALSFREDRLDVTDNVVTIPEFKIFGANDNPLVLNGTVNAKNFGNILFDLDASAENMQLIKSDSRSKADLFGKVFVNIGASVKGPMKQLDVNGNLNILGSTDATYRLNMEPSQLTAQDDQDVVRFVNFNDTTQVAESDSVAVSPLNMRINANLVVSPGTHVEVLLSNNGTDKLELDPSANLKYYQNYMGDMQLNGVVTLGNGYVRYSIPVIGEKKFTFEPSSTITFNGPIADPTLNITATDEVKANVKSGNNSRLVNFFVTAKVTNTPKNLATAFDLSTNDDLSIQNELQSMTADQRQTKAMNLLLYNQYVGQDSKAKVASGNMLYSFLESQINSWAAKNIRGVDLSFGVNQYDKTSEGVTNTETSYSYQVSKSLFNNRFKILVGGNYSTDSADDEIAQNLVSDVALEYMLKQTQSLSMSVKVFRHIGYESILEGEITEMGGAFVLKRKLENLKSLFRFRRRRKKTPTDSVTVVKDSVTLPEREMKITDLNDSVKSKAE